MPTTKPKRYRALLDLSLRKSAETASPLYDEWHEWPAGTVFEAPPNLNVKLALANGKIEEVKDGEG